MTRIIALFALLLLPFPVAAAPSGNDQVADLARAPAVARMLEALRTDESRTIADQVAITEIAAPSGQERARAEEVLRRFRADGLTDAAIDRTGNVIGLRRGSGKGPLLVVSAHLDTVFPPGDVPKVTRRDGRYYGHGIADDARGLAVMLAVLRQLRVSSIRTTGDILFVATVGEEGLGNLRGAKGLFEDRADIDGFITVEPSLDGISVLANGATGSRRWEIAFNGPGGHSFQDFGLPSAIHAMGRAIAEIADVEVPTTPKTSFTVGVVSGGTSVNTIAADAAMTLDIRANTTEALKAAEETILAAAARAASAENARWKTGKITVTRTLVGDRGAGLTPPTSPIVLAASAAIRAVGEPAPALITNSTDSNVPISLGIPALMMTGGGKAGGLHSPGEWFEPDRSWLGPQSVALTALALVGVENVSAPMLERRAR